jgi:hypothetical protein
MGDCFASLAMTVPGVFLRQVLINSVTRI